MVIRLAVYQMNIANASNLDDLKRVREIAKQSNVSIYNQNF